MDLKIDHLPLEKQAFLDLVTGLLANLRGVEAVVLGGSYARGSAQETSDLDVGIYYAERTPFSITEVRKVAENLATPGSALTVTGFYEWGAWVNGGAWIYTPIGKVDFLYRSLEHVERTIAEAVGGKTSLDFGQQPPYGFQSLIYLAETAICVPLYDPKAKIAALKEKVRVYPPRLREKLVSDYLWMTDFTLQQGQKYAEKGDIYNTAGCLTRAAAFLTQVLFAVNRRYFISDKTALAEIETFPLAPASYRKRVENVLGEPGRTSEQLAHSVEEMGQILLSAVALAGSYMPKYG